LIDCLKEIWSKRYDETNDFEKLIAIQNNLERSDAAHHR